MKEVEQGRLTLQHEQATTQVSMEDTAGAILLLLPQHLCMGVGPGLVRGALIVVVIGLKGHTPGEVVVDQLASHAEMKCGKKSDDSSWKGNGGKAVTDVVHPARLLLLPVGGCRPTQLAQQHIPLVEEAEPRPEHPPTLLCLIGTSLTSLHHKQEVLVALTLVDTLQVVVLLAIDAVGMEEGATAALHRHPFVANPFRRLRAAVA
jgi:hypothetical protein